MKLLAVGILLSGLASGQSPTITAVVNAADYAPVIGSGSLITIFGANLSASVASASSLPLPTSLAGTNVRDCWIGESCQDLPVSYVGPGQINAVGPYSGNTNGIADHALYVIAGGVTSGPFALDVRPQGPGIFRIGWDCSVAVQPCAITQSSSATHFITRGAILDQSENYVSSGNPMTVNASYTGYFTGSGYAPAGTNAYDVSISSSFRISSNPWGANPAAQFVGHSPCCAGLDQINFTIPQNVLLAFSKDGKTLPKCSVFTWPLKVEMLLYLLPTALYSSSDFVGIPLPLNRGDVDCSQ
jgi:uncharacterized protein (TIGR03437 family)